MLDEIEFLKIDFVVVYEQIKYYYKVLFCMSYSQLNSKKTFCSKIIRSMRLKTQ